MVYGVGLLKNPKTDLLTFGRQSTTIIYRCEVNLTTPLIIIKYGFTFYNYLQINRIHHVTVLVFKIQVGTILLKVLDFSKHWQNTT